MLLTIAVVLAVAVKLTINHSKSQQFPSDYEAIDITLSGLNHDVEQIARLDVLPKLETSWRKANSIAAMHGVRFTPYEAQANVEPNKGYTGALRNWSAQLEGDAHAALVVAKMIQSASPAFLYEYAISGGVIKINITIVGT